MWNTSFLIRIIKISEISYIFYDYSELNRIMWNFLQMISNFFSDLLFMCLSWMCEISYIWFPEVFPDLLIIFTDI